jgi:hypothetical protein
MIEAEEAKLASARQEAEELGRRHVAAEANVSARVTFLDSLLAARIAAQALKGEVGDLPVTPRERKRASANSEPSGGKYRPYVKGPRTGSSAAAMLKLLREHPAGLTRAQIKDAMVGQGYYLDLADAKKSSDWEIYQLTRRGYPIVVEAGIVRMVEDPK